MGMFVKVSGSAMDIKAKHIHNDCSRLEEYGVCCEINRRQTTEVDVGKIIRRVLV